MGFKITADKETEERYLTMTQTDHLFFLIYRSDYRSYFPFAYIDRTQEERFVGYAGAVCTIGEYDDSFDNPIPKGVDIYMCSNGMVTPRKRTSDNLINIQNLVIDIDSHQSELSMEALNEHIKKFQQKLIDRLIIKPNFVNRTGRGLQLWFCIEPCHVSLNKICLCVIDMLCKHIEEVMEELQEEELTIDLASSLKLNGLFRMPYTYNTKAKRWAEGEFLHEDLPNINDLRETLKEKGIKSRYFTSDCKPQKVKTSEEICETEEVKAKKRRLPRKKVKQYDYTPCMVHRRKFMDYLFQTRDIGIGSRDIMIFAMYSTLIALYDREYSREYCINLNDNFKEPLPYSELCVIFAEIDKKGHRFTVEKFFAFVKATEEERAWFNKATLKEERKRAKRQAKIDRNNKIKEMRANGVSVIEISKEMKLSRQGIYNILKS